VETKKKQKLKTKQRERVDTKEMMDKEWPGTENNNEGRDTENKHQRKQKDISSHYKYC
jgi:hypothetical protein